MPKMLCDTLNWPGYVKPGQQITVSRLYQYAWSVTHFACLQSMAWQFRCERFDAGPRELVKLVSCDKQGTFPEVFGQIIYPGRVGITVERGDRVTMVARNCSAHESLPFAIILVGELS